MVFYERLMVYVNTIAEITWSKAGVSLFTGISELDLTLCVRNTQKSQKDLFSSWSLYLLVLATTNLG